MRLTVKPRAEVHRSLMAAFCIVVGIIFNNQKAILTHRSYISMSLLNTAPCYTEFFSTIRVNGTMGHLLIIPHSTEGKSIQPVKVEFPVFRTH
jgi:hypothetical protein